MTIPMMKSNFRENGVTTERESCGRPPWLQQRSPAWTWILSPLFEIDLFDVSITSRQLL